jgi:hypothetical protein
MWLWMIPGLCYLLFAMWYTNLRGPLTAEEIDALMQRLDTPDVTPERIAMIRRFMEEDTGNQFIMVNNLDMAETPPELPATGPGAKASDLIDHYMEHMYPALFKRASHPVFFGEAVADAMDLTGIENAEKWTQGALFRYRSRRDVMEISTNPRFAERHEYKLAALGKTIAYPVEPVLYPNDLRFLLALILFSLVALVDLILFRRQTQTHG